MTGSGIKRELKKLIIGIVTDARKSVPVMAIPAIISLVFSHVSVRDNGVFFPLIKIYLYNSFIDPTYGSNAIVRALLIETVNER